MASVEHGMVSVMRGMTSVKCGMTLNSDEEVSIQFYLLNLHLTTIMIVCKNQY